MKYRSALTFLFIAVLLTRGASAADSAGTPDAKDWDKILYRDLTDVKQFFGVSVSLSGDAEKVGFVQNDVTEFARLKFKNLFTGFPVQDLPKDSEGKIPRTLDSREWAFLRIKITMVGTDYPVAYHISLRIEKLRPEGHGYEDSSLGYASAKKLTDGRIIKDALSDLMENAAGTLFRIQDKL
jgi:hypothetical protein